MWRVLKTMTKKAQAVRQRFQERQDLQAGGKRNLLSMAMRHKKRASAKERLLCKVHNCYTLL
jgi:hypothetical protein